MTDDERQLARSRDRAAALIARAMDIPAAVATFDPDPPAIGAPVPDTADDA